MNKVQVAVVFQGEAFEPVEITSLLGIHPTSFHSKGDELKYNKSAKTCEWRLSSGEVVGECPDVYELSRDLIQIVSPKVDLINKLKLSCNLSITLQVGIELTKEADSSTPPVGFDNEVIKFLGSVDASIDVDIY